MIMEHDENGFLSKVSFYDVENNLCENGSGYATVVYKNDVHGNTVEQYYYGIDGKRVDCSSGYTGVKCKYDEIIMRQKTHETYYERR